MNMDIINNITDRIKEIHLEALSCGVGKIAFNSLTFSKPIKPKSVKIPANYPPPFPRKIHRLFLWKMPTGIL